MRTPRSFTPRLPHPLGRRGVTAVEFLIVLIVLAVLVWLVQRGRSDPGARFLAAPKSDLRNLVTTQEAYFADHDTYASSLEDVTSIRLFTASYDVVLAVTTGGALGYSAVARSQRRPDRVCAVYVGSPVYTRRPWRGDAEGEVTCRDRKDLARAAEGLLQDCAAGQAASCRHAAVLYAGGWLGSADSARAVALLDQSCTGGYAPGCTDLGRAYRDGAGVSADVPRATAAFERGCTGGHAPGCVALGRLYGNGRGVPRNAGRAVAALTTACTRDGTGPGCGDLAARYLTGDGVPRDAVRAAALFRQACLIGHTPVGREAARACGRLAGLYQTGTGVSQSLESALRFHWMACEGGEPTGCAALAQQARRYEVGDGVARDPEQAVRLYQQACLDGRGAGCADLAALNERMCTGGDPEACHRLAWQYSSGHGVTRDPARAARLFGQACDGGVERACGRR